MTPRTPTAELSDETRIAKALAHPQRAELLARLNERRASPKELSELTGWPIENISYHVRVLRELDCIELVDTAPRRGAIEHYYRASARAMLNDEAWARLPRSAQRAFTRFGLRTVFEDVAQACDADTFDRRGDHHNSYTRLVLDDEGFAELAGLLSELLESAMRIEAESAARIMAGGGGGDEVRTRLSLMQYEPAPA